MEVAFFTNVGHSRKNNEDAILIQDKIFFETSFNEVKFLNIEDEYLIIAVADGMGGHEKGEIAAKITLEVLKREKPKTEKEIINSLKKARDFVEYFKDKNPEAYGLGTAVAGLIKQNDYMIIFNVGDCRVYKKVGRFLRKLSRDHTLVEELINKGYLDEYEAKHFPNRNVLTSAVVGDDYQTKLEVFTKEIKYKKGDIFLVCSDGFWEVFDEEELEEILSSDDIKEISDKIFKSLEKKVLNDNITFVILKI